MMIRCSLSSNLSFQFAVGFAQLNLYRLRWVNDWRLCCSSFSGVVPRQVELHQVAVLADEVGAYAVHSLLADQIRSEATFLQSVRVHLQYREQHRHVGTGDAAAAQIHVLQHCSVAEEGNHHARALYERSSVISDLKEVFND